MGRAPMLDLLAIPDLRWLDSGQCVLSGPLLALDRRLDTCFRAWAARHNAVEYGVPAFISAPDLARLEYFSSFPNSVTFPVALESSEANLSRFASGPAVDPSGAVRLAALAPIREVLTPAACYHFYGLLRGRTLEAPAYLTTRATCFRREAFYAPLERQWSFSMREIVCVGTRQEVQGFLEAEQGRLAAFFRDIELPIEFTPATDPFFRPTRNPKWLAQKLEPVKTELVFAGRLAIGSVNFHRNYFGEAFGIRRDGADAFSGCVAFGIERWIAAFLAHFGPEPVDWPELDQG